MSVDRFHMQGEAIATDADKEAAAPARSSIPVRREKSKPSDPYVLVEPKPYKPEIIYDDSNDPLCNCGLPFLRPKKRPQAAEPGKTDDRASGGSNL